MIIAFTGTRHGLTYHQRRWLYVELHIAKLVLHGGCIGADVEAHNIAMHHGATVQVWPSDLEGYQANLFGDYHRMRPMRPLKRNRIMVDAADFVLACPVSNEETLRSGTWSTIRYAKKVGRTVVCIQPDGRMWRSGPV